MNNTAKIALVPGASRPFGRAVAHAFGKAGISLALPYIDDWPGSVDDMLRDFSQCGYTFSPHRCELTKPDEVRELISAIEKQFGGLHYLINNIERGGMPVVHGSYDRTVNKSQWQLELDTTLKAKWELYRHSLPLIKQSGGGSITNISSIAGRTGRCGPASYLFSDGYSAANRAVQSLTESWAREAGPSIRVNEVMVGLVRGRHAENTRGWGLLSDDQQKALIEHTILKRTADPGEIADLVYYLAVRASYVTGSVTVADGGYCLGGEGVAEMMPGDV
ncbi:MAG: SDR family oxidoreductase [Desulfocapsaceae bacterium]|jgi:3-oxoacyl-[acyl-carrier protein] reductase|nr:SDR family oxidoreductase [Desulfocapsaceae bacterium]